MPNFYYKTDVPCDGVEIIIDQNSAGSPQATSEVQTTVAGSPLVISFPDGYVVGADNIRVFQQKAASPSQWTQQVLDTDYSEVDSTSISVSEAGAYKIIRVKGKLVEGVHYTRINATIISFGATNPSVYGIVKVYAINPAKSKINPAKIIDMDSEVVISTVPVWDPARGHHFHNAIHPINLQRGDPLDPDAADPALYNVEINMSATSDQPWESGRIGTTWFDTSEVGYIPYYDDKVFPILNDRLFYWGALAPWASINYYQWTESAVLPQDYDALSATQEGDTTIDETIRVTGQAKSTLYTRTRDSYDFTVTVESVGTQGVLLDTTYGVTAEGDLTGLGNSFTQDFVQSVTAAEQFTLVDGIYIGNSNLIVTVNGVLATAGAPTFLTYDSTTQFTVTATADDEILATITAPTYTSEITIDGGTPQPISTTGDLVQNFGQLIDQITQDISGATVVLNGNEILFTSNSSGATSTISINDEANSNQLLQLFGNLINIQGGGSPAIIASTIADGVDSIATSVGHPFSNGDVVIVSSSDTLPAPLTNTTYTIRDVYALSPDLDTFQFEDADGDIVVLTSTGVGIQSMVDSVWTETWNKEIDIHQVLDTVYEELQGTSGPIPATNFVIGDVVDVYVNEFFIEQLTVGSGSPSALEVTFTSYVLQTQDTIRLVKAAHIVTDEEAAFDPDVEDDGTINVQYDNFYNYTEITTIGDDGITEEKTYYFWVGDKTVHTIPNSALSLLEAQIQIVTIPTPYIVFQNLEVQEITTDNIILPLRYSQMVLRGHVGLINAEDRYVLRFTRDLTLRDRFENKESQPRLKDTHTEWEIFREAQQFNIPRVLWDKITEAMVGFTLADNTVRVPSRERELYDETYGTDTQYGIGDGEIFVDSAIAIETVLGDLTSPINDFYPVDINVFFDNNNFDTDENTISAMNTIYNTFNFEHVNRIYFSVLHDAFAKKAKYPDIFKTSMVSLHGIKLLETAGVFDD